MCQKIVKVCSSDFENLFFVKKSKLPKMDSTQQTAPWDILSGIFGHVTPHNVQGFSSFKKGNVILHRICSFSLDARGARLDRIHKDVQLFFLLGYSGIFQEVCRNKKHRK